MLTSKFLILSTNLSYSINKLKINFKKDLRLFKIIFIFPESHFKLLRHIYEKRKSEKMKKYDRSKIQSIIRFHKEFGSSEYKKLVIIWIREYDFILRFTLCKHIFKTSISFVKNKVLIVWVPRGAVIIVFLSIRYWY